MPADKTALVPWLFKQFSNQIACRYRRKKKAIIISTHILDEVPEVCNKCLIISEGKKVFEGTPNQLRRKVGKSLDEKFRKIVN